MIDEPPDEAPDDPESTIDVFPDAYQFIERRLGLILRMTHMVELSIDSCIARYLSLDGRRSELLMSEVLPYISVGQRTNVLKCILRDAGQDRDLDALIFAIKSGFKLRNLLAHSTLLHAPRPDHKPGDIPMLSWGRGGGRHEILRQADIEATLAQLSAADSRLRELSFGDDLTPGPVDSNETFKGHMWRLG